MQTIAILTHPRLTHLIRSVNYGYPSWINVKIVNVLLDKVQDTLESMVVNHEANVFVSSGANAACLKKLEKHHFVEIKVTGFDVLYALYRAREHGTRAVIISFNSPLQQVEHAKHIFSLEIIQRTYSSILELNAVFDQLQADGFYTVIGSSLVVEIATNRGMYGILVYSSDGVVRALDEAVAIVNSMREEHRKSQEFKAILDSTQSGIIAVDTNGSITVFNPAAGKILGIAPPKALGKCVTDVVPNSQLMHVLASHEEQYNQIQTVNGTKILSNRVPVLVNEQAVGAVATFQDFRSIHIAEGKIRSKKYERGFFARATFDSILGSSKEMQQARDMARTYAGTDFTVLITGETGTGKELFAAAIHNASKRHNEPFVAVNCSAFHESLLESELFGYEEGAFTGALKGGKAGVFELAHKGTIFLDEIADFPLHLQARLLRTLEEHTTMRIGSDRVTPVDIRVIAATNRSLCHMVEDGSFRRDLYYRLNVLGLHLPPLRSRPQDMHDLIRHFAALLNMPLEDASLKAMGNLLCSVRERLQGNVREFRNILERLSVFPLTDANCLVTLNSLLHEYFTDHTRQNIEQASILDALHKNGGFKTRAAEQLGISRSTLWRKLRTPPAKSNT